MARSFHFEKLQQRNGHTARSYTLANQNLHIISPLYNKT